MRLRRAVASLVVLALPLLGYASAALATPPATTSVAQRVEQWRVRGGIPAVSVAFRHGDGPIETIVNAAPGGDQQIGPDTQFRFASITKLLVATAVMQHVEAGTIDLDAAATEYMPESPVPDDVTVRQLLQHTSGLPDYGTPEFSDSLVAEPQRRWTAEQVLERAARQRQQFAPGSQWEYSNSNYIVLSQVLSAVSGSGWDEVVRREVLQPLGLRSTYMAGTESARGAGVSEQAIFDLDNDGDFEDIEDGSWPALETSEGAAGALVSTPSDITMFTSALFRGEVVTHATLRQMVSGSDFARRYDDYGLGVELRRPDLETPVWGHGGFLPGYRSVTWYVPSKDLTLTIAVNDSRADPSDLAELLLDGLN
jgi:D-alanyl-D-alanine carboxypeptidase